MDTKWAIVFEGTRYISHYVPLLRSGTYEEALEVALGYLCDEDIDIQQFKLIEIVHITSHTTAEHQAFFKKKYEQREQSRKQALEKLEREQFERLKKKFEQ